MGRQEPLDLMNSPRGHESPRSLPEGVIFWLSSKSQSWLFSPSQEGRMQQTFNAHPDPSITSLRKVPWSQHSSGVQWLTRFGRMLLRHTAMKVTVASSRQLLELLTDLGRDWRTVLHGSAHPSLSFLCFKNLLHHLFLLSVVCMWDAWGQRGCQMPWIWSFQGMLATQHGYWVLNTDPLEKQGS